MKGMFATALAAAFAMLSLWSAVAIATEEIDYKIVTASPRGTYIQIGRDLATYVAPQAEINLESVPSAGSGENVRRLRYEPGVKLALVQSDVFQAFLDMSAAGNAEAGKVIKPLRLIMPLYNEEIYFVVRKDSSLNYVHEIRDAKINAGELGSGTALSTATLYKLMFNRPIPEQNVSFETNEDALLKLLTDKSIDVVVIIAGQPAKILTDIKPEARDLIKLLKFDANAPAGKAALKTYFPATIRQSSYPNLLTEDIPGLTIKAFLVTYDYQLKLTRDHLVKFAHSLCENFPILQTKGHPKWKEVDLALPELGRGWTYYPYTTPALRACTNGKAKPSASVARSCATMEEKVLGLCSGQ